MHSDPISRSPLSAEAFAGNRLLAALPAQALALIEPSLQLRDIAPGEIVLTSGEPVKQTLFPCDGLMVSMLVELTGARAVEVASIGKEGAIGGIISCGAAPAFTHAVAQTGGQALAMPMHALELAKSASPDIKNLFCRYSDYLLSQVMQSVACNAFHPIEARTARWLLTAQDRVGSERIPLTQEALAGLLGVQRTTVNAIARAMQDQQLISYRRGAIQIRSREGLLKASCECYSAVEDHFANVLGSGNVFGETGC
ncbi:Crp/Fnr family transcriptional regulator [Sphingomonas sp. GCM10030256]|uniref:Crp/Fnr family transcriptional regulator n=1 Tax=Sphingomonas sp. GCM10030256 TaxID=3273427 RepID=UPI00361531AE